MTEQQISDGYRRLEEAALPPMDVAERVERRIRVRRRRRRTALAGGTTLAVLAVGGVVALGLSGDDGDDTVAVDQPPPTTALMMTRPDGSTYTFDDVRVSCTAPEAYGGAAVTEPGHIYLFSPIEISGSAVERGDESADDARAEHPFITFDGIVDKIQGDQTFTFPNDWTMSSDQYPMTLFVADSEGTPERGNEAASSAGGESGTVRVLEASCDPVPVLRLDIDMTLGSELEMDPIHVTGSVR